MSLFSFLCGRAFKHEIPSPESSFMSRFDAHGTKTISVIAVGESLSAQRLARKGRSWVDAPVGAEKAEEPAIVLLTTRTLTCEHKELPALPGGNSEAAIARAVYENPSALLREAYETERAYHLVPMDASRWALVFSMQKTDVQRSESEVARRGLTTAGIICGLARATKFAISQLESDMQTVVVCDQQSAVILSVRGGRVEHTSTLLYFRQGDEAAEREFREALIERARSDCAEGMQPSLDLFTSPHSAVRPSLLDGAGVSCRHHTISLLDLCFA